MSADPRPNGDPVPVAIAAARGREFAALIALLALVVAAGAFGRLVPDPAPATGSVSTPAPATPSPNARVRLVSPIAGVVHLRSTEVLVRGVAQPGIRRLEARVTVDGRPIGQAILTVELDRRFDGVVRITPPAISATATLEISEVGGTEQLVDVVFPIDAGAVLLPKDPSDLRGQAGGVMVVDVLVYGPLREVRGLLTGTDGHLFASASTMLSGRDSVRGAPPWTVSLELEIPFSPLPGRARLHLLGIDSRGMEVEHIDANVSLSND